jgi:hypothetical protein
MSVWMVLTFIFIATFMFPNFTVPVLKLDADFCLGSKLEHFCSQIMTVPIWDGQF